ncbi:MAG: hypothetical protein J6X55_12985 [Victivallales bacterium]|nr:hypothetical protein [Victivallales bacterium]
MPLTRRRSAHQQVPIAATRLSRHSCGFPWVALHRYRGCTPPTAGPSYAANAAARHASGVSRLTSRV